MIMLHHIIKYLFNRTLTTATSNKHRHEKYVAKASTTNMIKTKINLYD